MSCELSQTVLHGYFDAELDAVRAAEFERHLQTCPECQTSLDSMEALRTRLQKSDLYERVSPELARRVRQQLGFDSAARRHSSFTARRSFLIPAFAIAALVVIIAIALPLAQNRAQTQRVTAELIDAHIRSLQPGHLADVQSTDQHTVKPWFDGKLEFIPPVSDFANQGYPLVGGRLDVIDGHNVAALVYARRKHLINLFVWSAVRAGSVSDGSGLRQGYSWITWKSGDSEFCLVSDVSAADLQELKNLISR